MKNTEQFEFEYQLDGHEFIELNTLLKTLGLVSSDSAANSSIERGKVTVNDAVETQKRFKVRSGFSVVFNDKTIEVS